MDKKTLRRNGLSYRANLSDAEYRAKSDGLCSQLAALLSSIDGQYLSYTALLPGELNPAQALIDQTAIFIVPEKDAPMDYRDFNAVIVPMVAGDTYGNRIGMGGGWFDTFLSKHPSVIKIGCCYDKMLLAHLPSEPHDVTMDYICTETKTIHCTVE